ncbi:MAG: hypothetical protein MUO19_00460, partial [Dehalococcoidales bacterium]|nr:hypothetical protein [Dehalococcoidales bacterium]
AFAERKGYSFTEHVDAMKRFNRLHPTTGGEKPEDRLPAVRIYFLPPSSDTLGNPADEPEAYRKSPFVPLWGVELSGASKN